MTLVFIGGSISIRSLSTAVQQRLSNIIERRLSVIVGDAPGADSAVQRFFAERKYANVTVFHLGKCRNNFGGWVHTQIQATKGLPWFTCKDQAMAELADYGFMLWDGKSRGTKSNILTLANLDKTTLLFLAKSNEFQTILPKGEFIEAHSCEPASLTHPISTERSTA